MIHDNIRKYRREKGLSQEELAARLHVVRQTVSKWERGLSAPDADALIALASALEVPVDVLLGTGEQGGEADDSSGEFARLNEALACEKQKAKLAAQSGEKRGTILLLSFASMFIALMVKNSVLSVLLSGGCVVLAAVVLYRNMALLTGTADDLTLKPLRSITLLNIAFLLLGIVLACLTAADVLVLSQYNERLLAMFLVACVMSAAGIAALKLPYSRHTGLRLPWTLLDRDTWNLAHRVLGFVSLPLALLYIGCALTIERFEAVTLAAMVLWIGIPGGISYAFFARKMKGKR